MAFKPFKNVKNLFGGGLALILLFFYVGTWGMMLLDAILGTKTMYTPDSEGFFYIATTVSGIASALAVGILGATPAGQSPSIKNIIWTPNTSRVDLQGLTAEETQDTLTQVYLLAWVLIGVLCVIYGVMPAEISKTDPTVSEHKLKVLAQISNYGTIWFGMAMSAVFVYLKIQK